jgi:glycosyltransferase involved in cell wall biosynthesis
MRNLQIGDNDLIGNRFNGHDLHRYLRRRGITSDHLVKIKRSDDPHTHVLGEEIRTVVDCDAAIRAVEKTVGTHSLHYPLSFSLFSDPLFLRADVVHYHLIHNFFFNLNLLPQLTALKPSVWTIHDPWITTGHCIYPLDCPRWKTGCGDCPYPDTAFPLEHDSSALNWELKREILQRCRLDLIVASKHMRDLARQSPLLSHFDIHLIPFGIDLARFAPTDGSEARARLGIPPGDLVLCFRADRSRFKGYPYIEEVLRQLSARVPITLLTVGVTDLLEPFRDKFTIVNQGWLTDDDKMLDVYRAADIFLMPSTAEAFGMMAIEAMACGKPVIVAEGTSLPDVVFAPEGGIAVPQGDAAALRSELEGLIADRAKRLALGARARKLAERHYDKGVYVSRIIELYEEVIAKRKTDDRSSYILAQQNDIAKRRRLRVRAAQPVVGVATAAAAAANAPVQCGVTGPDPYEELAQIKSSLYFRAYNRLRKKRLLQLLSRWVVKPGLRAAWRSYGIVRRAIHRGANAARKLSSAASKAAALAKRIVSLGMIAIASTDADAETVLNDLARLRKVAAPAVSQARLALPAIRTAQGEPLTLSVARERVKATECRHLMSAAAESTAMRGIDSILL